MKMLTRIIAVGGTILVLALAVKVYFDTNTFKVHHVSFRTEKLPAGTAFTVLHMTDLHNKVFDEGNNKLIQTALKLDPDIIVITGDLIDRGTEKFGEMLSFVEKLTNRHEHVYYVTGNHEWDNPRIEELLIGLRERNVTILNNKNEQIVVNDTTINLVGVDNVSTGHENMDKAFTNINEELYTIFLSHAPTVVNWYDDIPADLILSGHTHGGQVRLPLLGAIVAPDEGFFPEYVKGTYEMEKDRYLYIDSGLGSSTVPIRFMNQSQMSFLTIHGKE